MKTTLLYLLFMLSVTSAFSATIVVTSTNDSGPGTLRQAVIDANPGDKIIFDGIAGSESNPIMLNSSIYINKTVSILGRVSGLPINYPVTAYIKMNANQRLFDIENANGVSFSDIVFMDGYTNGVVNTYEAYGGAILIKSLSSSYPTSLNLSRCVFKNNHATEGGAITAISTDLSIIECTFENNTATARGGAVVLGGGSGNPDTALFSRCKFISNTAGTKGGAIFRSNPYTTIYNSLFNDNTAEYGGAIALESSSNASAVEERNNTFAFNTATANASTIYLDVNQKLKTYNSIHVDNNSVANTIYGESNAGIDFKRIFSNNTITVPNVIGSEPYTQVQGDIGFYDASNNDFRVLAFSSTINAGDSELSNYLNETDLDGNPRQTGSNYDLGAYENGCNDQVVTQVTGNAFGSFSKAVLNLCEGKTVFFDPITNNTPIIITETSQIFKNNITLSGNGKDTTILQMEAGANQRHLFSDGKNLTIEGIHFKDGNAQVISESQTSSSGGAILVANANLNISHSKFSNNTSTAYGGAIIMISGNLTSKHSEYINNTATNGGAILISAGNITSTNNLYAKNNGSIQAGTIYLTESSNSIFTNDALVDNTSNDRSGIGAFSNSNVTLQNTIVINPGNDMGRDASSSFTANNTNFDSNFGISGNNNIINSDPEFIDATNDNYRLSSSSPLLDAGNNSYNNETEDLDGNSRIVNGTIDIGPYESRCTIYSGNVIFVNANVSGGTNDGLSWANAIPDLNEALSLAESCTTIQEIWVASGTYKPGTLDTDTFTIPEGVTLLGGFSGNETNVNDRNWLNNPTTLSGDINNSNSSNAGDSHTIIKMVKNNITLDGFIIQNSYADSTDGSTFAIGRSGAGIYNAGNNTISNCIFHRNYAEGTGENGIGGGIVNFSGTLNINNSLFFKNNASGNGGAISIESGTVNLTNATIANNTGNKGGGIHFYNGNLVAINSIFTNNSGINGNINNDNGIGSANVSYSLFFNSTDSNNGDIPSGIINDGNNITYTDPIYNSINNVNGYKLTENSTVVNLGTNTGVTQSTDLAGNPRIFDTTVDIGAYELQSTLSITNTLANDFKIYPNPVNNILNIKTDIQKYNYRIYNIQGQEVLKANNVTSSTIDLSTLHTGIYVLNISSDNKSQSFKITKL
ncbi:choice-of-anchor Q domain-containing protein [Winogradskyella marincola]|uniref:Choice-of-anchor Q domain-containing protein n=1 Tax=Winogradskyella marincola TaxID=3037795 RepID=A0ABT6G3T7_9FLAO|nr:choice-of-anchor Q domain-containing protein [Winogradskyella sp. YYF002]MDG4716640.1 choice-of-anchor Q domain-containing protein [Winogradskyella sp. YYF002]